MSGYAVPIYLPRRRRIITPGEWLRDKLDEQRRAREAEIALAVTVDQSTLGQTSLGTSAGTIVLTTTAVVASAGFIVLIIGFDTPATSVASVAGGSLTWTIDKQANNATSGDRVAVVSAYASAGLASSTAITATLAGGNSSSRMMGAMSFLGVDSSGTPVDGTPVSATQATAAWTSGNYVTSTGGVIVAVSETDTATTNTTTAPSIETHDFQEGTGGNTLCGEYRIDAGAGTRTVAGTWGSAANGIVAAVAYKAAGGTFIAPPERRAMQAVNRSSVW